MQTGLDADSSIRHPAVADRPLYHIQPSWCFHLQYMSADKNQQILSNIGLRWLLETMVRIDWTLALNYLNTTAGGPNPSRPLRHSI